jgi:hypothetical protein
MAFRRAHPPRAGRARFRNAMKRIAMVPHAPTRPASNPMAYFEQQVCGHFGYYEIVGNFRARRLRASR